MLKFFIQNFWYDVILKLIYFKSLKKNGIFDKDEIAVIKKEFKIIVSDNKSMPGDVYSDFHLSWCSAILATYKACLKKKMTKEKSIEFTANAIFENMKADNIAQRIKTMLDKSNDPFKTIVNSSKYQEENFFGSTFVITRPIDDDNHYLCIISKCFYNDFFRRNESQELMQIACRWDYISWTKGIIPDKHKIKFERKTTLGLDNQECPFDFERIIN
jgi:hypothetical protein